MSDEMQLLIDLHKDNERQGPGGTAETDLALYLSGLELGVPLSVADIGCGTGSATLQLADRLNAHITSVDLLPDFLDVLMQNANEAELDRYITPLCASMDALPFEENQFDVLWSEGAIYNIGFQQGI